MNEFIGLELEEAKRKLTKIGIKNVIIKSNGKTFDGKMLVTNCQIDGEIAYLTLSSFIID